MLHIGGRKYLWNNDGVNPISRVELGQHGVEEAAAEVGRGVGLCRSLQDLTRMVEAIHGVLETLERDLSTRVRLRTVRIYLEHLIGRVLYQEVNYQADEGQLGVLVDSVLHRGSQIKGMSFEIPDPGSSTCIRAMAMGPALESPNRVYSAEAARLYIFSVV